MNPNAADTDLALPELAGWRRPRLRDDVPLLWRGQTSIQIGDDVVVDRITPTHVSWLTVLDGLNSPDEIEATLTIPATDARRLLRALLRAGALDDAAVIPAPMRWVPQVDRDQAVRRFGATLRTVRDLATAVEMTERRDRVRVALLGSNEVFEALTCALAAAGLRPAAASEANIVILADGHHPDVPAHFDHALQDLPHLQVGILGERATVGPLVVPGRTSCLRCAHLHRRDADPAWPLLAVQWAQAVAGMATPPIDPLLVRIAAGHAALLVRTWADAPEHPHLWADHALDIRLPEGRVDRVARPPHALCGCRWPDPDPLRCHPGGAGEDAGARASA